MPFFQQCSERAWNATHAHIRAMVTLDTFAWQNGMRMTIINIIPLLVGALIGQLAVSIMAFLGAFCVALADVGGEYRSRARAMLNAALLMTVTALVATIVGANIWLVTLLLFVWAFLGSMVSIYGNSASKVGFTIICVFTLVMGQPASIEVARIRVIAIIIGAIWSLIISLWLWPFRPFLPARRAVSAYYLAVSKLLRKACQRDQSQHWNEGVKQERARLLEAHDKAHQIVAIQRSQRLDAQPINSLLAALVLQADTIMEAVIALAEELATHTSYWGTQAGFVETMEQCATFLEQLARTIADAKQTLNPELLERSLNSIEDQEYALRAALPQLVNNYSALINARNLANLLKRMNRLLRETRNFLTQPDQQGIMPKALRIETITTDDLSWKEVARERVLLLKDNLTPCSFTLRHALRLATISAIAVAGARLLHVPYWNWIPLTILFVLKPDYGSTREYAFQRMLGTVIGGILGTLLVTVLHGNVLIFPVMTVLAFFCGAHLNKNHILFVQFFTTFVIMMFNMLMPGDWPLAFIRIAHTLVGGGLGILAGWCFWPQWERERLPQQMGRTILANRAYITSVLTAYMTKGDKKAEREAVRQASKAAHLQNVNAAAAFQRLLSEPKTSENELERFSILVTYNQRFCDSVTALAVHIPAQPQYDQFHQLNLFSQQLQWMLRDIEEATHGGKRLGLNPSFKDTLRDVLGSLQHLLAAYPVSRAQSSPRAFKKVRLMFW